MHQTSDLSIQALHAEHVRVGDWVYVLSRWVPVVRAGVVQVGLGSGDRVELRVGVEGEMYRTPPLRPNEKVLTASIVRLPAVGVVGSPPPEC